MTFRHLAFLSLAGLALCPGCRRAEVRVYRVPKEEAAPQAAAPGEQPARAQAAMQSARPKVGYQQPPGWTVGEGGEVSALTFDIATAGGKANVNVTPLGNFAGREAMLVNMWRQQVGAAPLADAAAAQELHEVEVAGAKGQIFEVSGTGEEQKPRRIVTAMLNRPDGTWFFKLSGDDAVVTAQKPVFLDFLKTFQFAPAETPSGDQPAAPDSTPAPR